MKPPDAPTYLGRIDRIAAAPYRPGEYDPPAEWTPEWVDVRLTEAFDTLMRLPQRAPGPKMFGNAMPAPTYSDADLAAQMETGELARARKRALQRRSLASPAEIRRMDDALAWPLRFLKNESPLAKAVVWSSFRKAVKREDKKLHTTLGVSRRTFFRYRLQGLNTICDGLKSSGRRCE